MFTNIFVPTDFSPASDAALEYAKTLAERFGASLHLVHVLEDGVVTGAFGTEVYVPDTPGMHEGMIHDAEMRLEQRFPKAMRERMRGDVEIVAGTSAKAIVDLAIERNADLIVMGTHGRHGVAHMLMGSVAEKVVRSAPCPVLTVHAMPATITETVSVMAAASVPA